MFSEYTILSEVYIENSLQVDIEHKSILLNKFSKTNKHNRVFYFRTRVLVPNVKNIYNTYKFQLNF